VLLALCVALPASGVTVFLGDASTDCGVPVTLPLSVVNQTGALRILKWRVEFDPTLIRFNEFEIDPRGVLVDFRSETRFLSPGSVEITLTSGGVTVYPDGLFGTINFALVSPSPGPISVDVRDVRFVNGIQGLEGPGVGRGAAVTTDCPTDRRGRPEAYRFGVLAGSTGGGGFADGQGASARFVAPFGIAKVGEDLFLTDSRAHTVRRMSPDGTVTTWAGAAGVPGSDDGVRGGARFDTPEGIVALNDGSLLVADRGNGMIRRIAPDGTVSRWAGTGVAGHRDGSRLQSQFSAPSAMAIEPSGSILITDPGSCTVRRMDADRVTTLAGVPNLCGLNSGNVAEATFEGMSGIVSHPTLGILISDDINHIIRRIVAEVSVLTHMGIPGEAGTADGLLAEGRLWNPRGLTLLSDQSFLIATANGIRRVSGNSVQTIAGGSSRGWTDGTGPAARLNEVAGIVSDGGVLHVTELGNTTIRRVSATYEVTTVAGSVNVSGFRDDAGPAARFSRPWQVASDAVGNVFVADRANRCIRRVTPEGIAEVWAGRPGVAGGNDGQRLQATFDDPAGLVIDSSGNIWVSEPSTHVIRMITPDGNVMTVAGQRNTPGFTDGRGTGSRFNSPMQLAADAGGSIYIADRGNNAIRRIGTNGTILTIAGSRSGDAGSTDGDVTEALFNGPTAVAVGPDGRIVVADKGNHAVREIKSGIVSTILAVTELEGQADGSPPGARMLSPEGVTLMPDGSIIVTEPSGRIRRIKDKSISTLAGRFGLSGNQSGLGADALFAAPVSVSLIGNRSFVVSDSANDALVRATRCPDDALCLNRERFDLTLHATDPRTGNQAEGLPIAENDIFGFFSLPGLTGNAANPEVFVKVLDGRGVNGKYWVFYGGLTDLELDLEVYDRSTGATKNYEKPGYDFCGGADTGAFDKGVASISARRVVPANVVSLPEASGCDESSLCLRSGRFHARLSATDPRTGGTADGVPIPRTGDFGYFSLPGLTGSAANPEVFIKVLDGRGVNGKYWVFYGGLTDFEFTLEVTDSESGTTRTYVRPGLEFCGGADTEAF
jgi:sugar lactone lactonase YvrE